MTTLPTIKLTSGGFALLVFGSLAVQGYADSSVVFVPGPGAGYTSLTQRATISEDGQASVTLQGSDGNSHSVMWGLGLSEAVALPMGGFTDTFSSMTGDSGLTVGYGQSGSAYGALRWSAAGNVTQLGSLKGPENNGAMELKALAINQSDVVVGYSQIYTEDGTTPLGTRAVRWDAGSSSATALPLASSNGDYGTAQAKAISNTGIIAGEGALYIGGSAMGQRGIRWESNGTVALTLNAISTDTSGFGFAEVTGVNDAGMVIGNSRRYSGDTDLGLRAVRWEPGQTEPTELGTLGTDASGKNADTTAIAVDNFGNIAGLSQKYVNGVAKGTRPVVWKAGSTEPLELQVLGTNASGSTRGNMSAMNNAGFIAGTVQTFDSSFNTLGRRAVVWDLDGEIFNLNNFIDPDSGWILTVATDITDSGWVTGYGTFDPDGSGPMASYERYFSLQSELFAVPEPGSALLLVGGIGMLGLRRWRFARCTC